MTDSAKKKNDDEMETGEPGPSGLGGQQPPTISNDDDVMKLSHLLATNAIVTDEVVRLFQDQALKLMSNANGRLRVGHQAWLTDYLKHQPLMYTRLAQFTNQSSVTSQQVNQEQRNDEQPVIQPATPARPMIGSQYNFHTPPTVPRLSEEGEAPSLSRASHVSGSFVGGANQAELAQSFHTAVPKIRLNELVQKPELFNGNTPPARRWLDDYERAAEANAWTDLLKVRYFSTFLEKSAHDWHITIARRKLGINPEWSDLKAAFIRHYLGDSDRRSLRQQLESCKQGENEKVVNFIPRVMRLIQLIDPNMTEDECVEIIRDKLRREITDKIILANIYTLEQLNDNCLKVETALTLKKSYSRNDSNKNSKQTSNHQKSNYKRGDRSSSSNEHGKTNNRGQPSGNKKSQRVNNKECYRCGFKGHVSSECYAKKKSDGTPLPAPDKKGGKGNGGGGGINTVQNTSTEGEDSSQKKSLNFIGTIVSQDVNLVRDEGSELIDLPLVIDKELFQGKVDTGAVCSVIAADLVRSRGWPVRRVAPELSHAAGGKLDAVATLEIEVCVKINKRSESEQVKFIVIENLCTQLIVGIDLIRKFGLIVDACNEQPVYFRPKKKGVRTYGPQILQARSISLVQAKVHTQARTIATRPFNFSNKLMGANAVVEVNEDGLVCVPLVNIDTQDQHLRSDQQIASFSVLDEEGLDEKQSQIGLIHKLDDSNEFVLVGDQLDAQQIEDLSRLFKKHLGAFSIGGELGRCDLVEHEIELLPGAAPFKEPRRRHPPAHADEADIQVREMLERSIVEPSSSPWASEYVMVRKKNNQWRLCIDFRRLNRLTRKNAFPLPDIEECLENLSGKMFFSKLDFASGYWQVPVAEASREYTAFRTREGLFQFRVMPFGLTNAPASFQKLINLMFAGMRGLSLQLFLDDVCVATDNWEEHLQVLDKVFVVVERAKMKLNSKKCEFGLKEVIFLGHKISSAGVQQDPSKLEALAKLPPPTDVSGVRRILGGFGYYRRFVFNFAAITAPIAKLTRKGEPFVWGREQEESFRKIKDLLLENATLSHLEKNGEIILKTDASKQGIAGLIQQNQGGDWRLVTCCSRGLSSSELNYSVTELEALAVIYSLSKFRYYLLGRKFTILVDHQALRVWNKSKLPNNERLQRWSLALSDYDCTLIYVKGKHHEDVDLFSRAPAAPAVDNFLPHILLIRPVDPASWMEAYDADEWQEKADEKVHGFYKSGGIVYRKGKLFVPPSKREAIMAESHDSLVGAHDGIAGTMGRITDLFWWPGMDRDVDAYVRRCHICQMRKVVRRKPPGAMRHHLAFHPLHKVAVDHLGKLPSAVSGECYVIVAIDVYSKYVVARAVEAQTSDLVERFIMDFVANFGVPLSLVSDNSMAFMSQGVRRIASLLGIKMIQAVPRHSRGNAVAERAIESVQEKISLITQQDKLDWAAALPFAILSLNTKRHTTTGYTPYQLFFNREMKPIQSSIELTPNLDTLGEAARLNIEEVHANAVARTADAQSESKERFDRNRPEREYQMGDKVLIRASDRAPKLANKYEGPFNVVAKKEDIYELENSAPGAKRVDRRRRHVSQLKPYVLLLMMVQGVTANVHLHQTSPVYWTKVDDKFVSSGSETVPFLYYHVSPCQYILQYADLIEKTHGSFIINTPVKNRNHTRNQVIPDDQPNHESNRPTISRNSRQLHAAGPLQPPSPLMIAAQTYHAGCVLEFKKLRALLASFNVVPDESQAAATDKPVPAGSNLMSLIMPPRQRRQVGFIAGIIVNDLYHLFVSNGRSESSTEKIQELINSGLAQQQKKVDLLKMATRINNRNTQKLANQVYKIEDSVETIPTVEVFASQVTLDIRDQIKLGERLLASIREKSMDHVTLTQFMGTNKFDQLEARDAKLSRCESHPPDVVKFEFSGYIRSNNYSVYKVHAISHFTNYTGVPVRNNYEGRTQLIYNNKLDCVKSVDHDAAQVILDECTTRGGRDASLQLWHQVRMPNAKKEIRRSTSEAVWPYIIVYCWGNRIQVEKEWTECPPYTCLLGSDKSFRTSDNLVSHTASTVQSTRVIAKFDVHEYHLPDYQPSHITLNRDMELIDELTAKVNDSIVLQWEETEVTWYHLFVAHSGFFCVIIMVLIIVHFCNKFKAMVTWPAWPSYGSSSDIDHAARQAAHQAAQNVASQVRAEIGSQVTNAVNSQFNNALQRALSNGARRTHRGVQFSPVNENVTIFELPG